MDGNDFWINRVATRWRKCVDGGTTERCWCLVGAMADVTAVLLNVDGRVTSVFD